MSEQSERPLAKAFSTCRKEIEQLFSDDSRPSRHPDTLAARLDVMEVAREEVAASVVEKINKKYDHLMVAFD